LPPISPGGIKPGLEQRSPGIKPQRSLDGLKEAGFAFKLLTTHYLLTYSPTYCLLLTAYCLLTKAGFAFKLPRRLSEDRSERNSGGDATADPRPAAALIMPAMLLEFIAKHELAGDAAQERPNPNPNPNPKPQPQP